MKFLLLLFIITITSRKLGEMGNIVLPSYWTIRVILEKDFIVRLSLDRWRTKMKELRENLLLYIISNFNNLILSLNYNFSYIPGESFEKVPTLFCKENYVMASEFTVCTWKHFYNWYWFKRQRQKKSEKKNTLISLNTCNNLFTFFLLSKRWVCWRKYKKKINCHGCIHQTCCSSCIVSAVISFGCIFVLGVIWAPIIFSLWFFSCAK